MSAQNSATDRLSAPSRKTVGSIFFGHAKFPTILESTGHECAASARGVIAGSRMAYQKRTHPTVMAEVVIEQEHLFRKHTGIEDKRGVSSGVPGDEGHTNHRETQDTGV